MLRLEGGRRDEALDIVRLNGQVGYVHSVFQNVLNIELFEGDRLIAISTPRRPLAPDMIQLNQMIDFRTVAPDIGNRVTFGEVLAFENGIQVSLEATPVNLLVKTCEFDDASIDSLYTFLVTYGKAGGMLRPYQKMMEGTATGHWNAEERFIDQVMQEGRLERLIGLGPGLTPAGDDFVSGKILGDQILGRVPELGWGALLESRDKTTRVSYHMLRHAYHGRTNEAVLAFFEQLTDTAMQEAAKRVLEIGSTSGTDFLTGVHAALIEQRSGKLGSSNNHKEENIS
ncbi:DUF2877 domain-containing protein [Exiguobacterium sp. SH0S2]|uniref:DUF2877 domain-containing protein n=1 Tax=Exiguobacterium sp. SH0S2 TaxID=2510950 RepID=UPI00103ED5EE|nr:DUF2877 domain-containing protein [Exiguobacterium sp. SH0S2]TCI62930.1 DUF2877 domain-containing protein [Exiguobacterium sp. SH0S2]